MLNPPPDSSRPSNSATDGDSEVSREAGLTESHSQLAELITPSDTSTETSMETYSQTGSPTRSTPWAALLLLLILGLGAFFRFTGIEWDDSYHLHPDERFLTDVASLLRSTDPITYLKTSESPLNPYNVGKSFYVYGNFPMTVTRLAAEAADQFCLRFSSICEPGFIYYDGIHLVGRFLSALADIITILVTYFLGKRLYDWRVGLLGAFLMTAAVLPIQQSHFFTMDNWAAMLTTISLYAAVRASEDGSELIWWAAFGIGLGLTVASRINVAPLAVIAPVAALVWLLRRSQSHGDGNVWRYVNSNRGSSDLQWAIAGVLLAAVLAGITFRIAQPYAFADAQIVREEALLETGEEPGFFSKVVSSLIGLNPQWLDNMSEIQNLQSPDASFPPALQWTNRAAIWFPLTNMVLWGMGITAGIAAVGGFFWALWRLFRGRPGCLNQVILLSWVGFYFLFMATRWVKSVRYFLPIYPALFLLAGWALVELWTISGKNRFHRAVAIGAILLVVVPTFLWANAFVDIYRQPVTRVQASEWMLSNIPSGLTAVYDSNGFEEELQIPLKRFEFLPGNPPLYVTFKAPADGQLKQIRFNYLSDPDQENGLEDGEQLLIRVINVASGEEVATAGLELNLTDKRETATFELGPVDIFEGSDYTIVTESGSGGPISVSTSVLANEHWDDPLPVRYKGIDPYSLYFDGLSAGQMSITHPDDEQKLADLVGWLDEADYIVLSSQRALWSLPRLPLTFPMTIRYYEALFNEELGFTLENQFHADLSVGPLQISDVGGGVSWNEAVDVGWPPPGDLAVEEAFSVYDHPPVWIFKKSADFNLESAEQILGAVDLSQVVVLNPGQATKAANGLLLTSEEQTSSKQAGTYSDLFNIEGFLARHPWIAALVLWLAVVLLGWLAYPLTGLIFRGLPDRGFLLSRIFGLLFIAYLSWTLASSGVLPSNRMSLILITILLVLISTLAFIHDRKGLISFLKTNRRYILFAELFTFGLFFLFLFIRAGNPDVWDVIWGGEKPMDLSYFNAVLKSESFPPYDPWFAGGYINYYYFGFVFLGALTELLGIPPTIAYNLLVPMLFSFSGGAAFTIAFNLIARNKFRIDRSQDDLNNAVKGVKNIWSRGAISAGIFAAVFCVLLGNLAEIPVTLNAWQKSSDTTISTGVGPVDYGIQVVDGAVSLLTSERAAPIYPGDWFWSASRAISAEPGEVQPITEFPFFTFLYGDLHAHMIALPLTILALGWAVSLALLPGQEKDGAFGRSKWMTGVTLLGGSMIVAILWGTNSWDYPTYLVISILSIAYFVIGSNRGISVATVVRALALSLVFIALTLILIRPFTANYGQPYSSFSLWQGSYTSIPSYLAVYGLFLFIVIVHLIREFRSWSSTWTTEYLAKWEPIYWLVFVLLFGFILFSTFLFIRGYSVAPLALTLTLTSGLLGLRRGLSIERRIPLIIISAAFFLTIFVEIIVLDGDIGRMNTVFKFYLQVWVMLSIVCGAAVVWIGEALRYRSTLRTIWRVVLVLLIAAAALYPLLATKAKWDIRMSEEAPITLDGMEFMRTTRYTDTALDGSPQTVELHYDYDAIRWMLQNVEGSPVIAEAHSTNPYRSIGNRVSMYTGLPAIIGWDWHQRQQRALLPGEVVGDRIADVNTLFNTIDKKEAEAILDKYDVQYIYAGQLEWIYYHPQGILKFEEMAEEGLLDEVYRNGGVSIYEVLGRS